MKSMILIIALFLIKPGVSYSQVNILVNKGPFLTVQQASDAEDRVNFFDKDKNDDRACTECFAAAELAKFLSLATEIKPDEIRFADHKVLPNSGTVFVIGNRFTNSLLNKYDLPEGTRLDNEQSYSIRSFREKGRIITIIEGVDRIGTLYGVYRYLEELGIKFIGLGEKGTIIPDSRAAIPDDLNINENPSYLTRGFYTWNDRKTGKDFFLWMARNKINYWTAQGQPVNLLKKFGVKLSDGGHRIQGVVLNSDDEYPYNHPLFKNDESKPEDPYKVGSEYKGDTNNDNKLTIFEAHPEWYGMKDGSRIKIIYSDNAAQRGTNFCTSNVDARKEFAKRIVQQLIDGQWRYVDVFEFWMFDGGADLWCSCDKCKVAGSFTDKMFEVSCDILKELERAESNGNLNRPVELSSIAYSATLEPPQKPLPEDYDYKNSSVTFFPIRRCYAHSFADPECTEINQWQLKAYQGWTTGEQRHYKGSMFIGEYYNVSSFKTMPVVFTKIMAVDIPWYYRNGARQFNYMHTPDTIWGTWTLNQYLLGQLLWNINLDVNRKVNDYFNLYYPATGFTTRKFYEQLETATANIKVFKHNIATEDGQSYSLSGRLLKGDLFQLDHLQYEEYHPLLNDAPDVVEMVDAMEMAKKYLETSLLNCKPSLEQQRLIEDNERFEYGYAMYRYIYHMVRTSVFHKEGDKTMAAKEFAIVKKYAGELKNMVEVVQSSSDHANAPNGFEATGSVAVFTEFMKLYDR